MGAVAKRGEESFLESKKRSYADYKPGPIESNLRAIEVRRMEEKHLKRMAEGRIPGMTRGGKRNA